MIKNYLAILLVFVPFIVYGQIVNIPNENFKNALLNQSPNIDLNNDSEIQLSEAIAYSGSIDVSWYDITDTDLIITDFTGIEAFINIIGFSAVSQLYSGTLDFSTNTELTYLNIGYSEAHALNISNNTNLIYLDASGPYLNSLDVSHLLDLETLIIRHTDFSSIDLSQNIHLKELSFFAGEISSIDLSNNLALERLHTGGAPLPSLDVTHNINLKYLEMQSSTYTSIDLSQNVNLEHIACYGSDVLNFDLSNNSNLKSFGCGNNLFTHLDFSDNTNLERFVSQGNTNLEFVNLKNGNNSNMIVEALGHPNLITVCVDDVAYAIANFIYVDDADVFSTCDELSINDDQALTTIKIFPNPILNNRLHIQLNSSIRILDISFISLTGQEIVAIPLIQNSNRFTLDTQSIASGIVFLKLVTDQGVITKKIVK